MKRPTTTSTGIVIGGAHTSPTDPEHPTPRELSAHKCVSAQPEEKPFDVAGVLGFALAVVAGIAALVSIATFL